MEQVTPASNRVLQERIYKEHLLISPFAAGSRVNRGNFPRRNRVMAAISDATVVIEATETSGTLVQSEEAVALGRWLFIARSCAEDPKLSWPGALLRGPNARVLTATSDILSALEASKGTVD